MSRIMKLMLFTAEFLIVFVKIEKYSLTSMFLNIFSDKEASKIAPIIVYLSYRSSIVEIIFDKA